MIHFILRTSAICSRKSHRCQFYEDWDDTLMNEALMESFVPHCCMLKHSLFCYRLYYLSWHFLLTSTRFYFWFLTCFINNVMIAIAHCLFSSSNKNGDRCFVVGFCLVSVRLMIENNHDSQLPVMLAHLQLQPAFMYFISAWYVPKVFQTT